MARISCSKVAMKPVIRTFIGSWIRARCQKTFIFNTLFKVPKILADTTIEMKVMLHVYVETIDAHSSVKPCSGLGATLCINIGSWMAIQKSIDSSDNSRQDLIGVSVITNHQVINNSCYGMFIAKSKVVNI